jgi:hypothetical protein
MRVPAGDCGPFISRRLRSSRRFPPRITDLYTPLARYARKKRTEWRKGVGVLEQCLHPKGRTIIDVDLFHEASGNVPDQPPVHPGQTGDVEAEARLETISVLREGNEPETVIANRYTLLEKTGEGGMGEVWVAKQTEPVKRKVALKLIKKGTDSKAVMSRFEQERQALAMMDHPNIARVLDGGITPTGQPYFVMELAEHNRQLNAQVAAQQNLIAELQRIIHDLRAEIDGVKSALAGVRKPARLSPERS